MHYYTQKTTPLLLILILAFSCSCILGIAMNRKFAGEEGFTEAYGRTEAAMHRYRQALDFATSRGKDSIHREALTRLWRLDTAGIAN